MVVNVNANVVTAQSIAPNIDRGEVKVTQPANELASSLIGLIDAPTVFPYTGEPNGATIVQRRVQVCSFNGKELRE
jgi:hypothetical protein